MPAKKAAPSPFKSRARAHSIDGPDQIREEDVGPGEFRDTSVVVVPAIPRAEVSMTIQFRATVRIVRGDIVTLRLGGFKGNAPGVFTLESRPHPENKDYHDFFHAFWSGESAPKGGPPAQSITLQCRKAVEQNALVTLGVPEAVHINLPDKLALNSPKLKIEGNVRHAAGGKIGKAPVMSCNEVKKRGVDEDVTDLQAMLKDIAIHAQFDDEENQFAYEVSVQEADQVWEATRDFSELKLGLGFNIESNVFQNYDDHAPLTQLLTENYLAASKKRVPLALHKEIAANLGVKVGVVVCMEDAMYTTHGCHYELTRAAILVMRLYTCESHDLCRLFGLPQCGCIYRELNSAVRAFNKDVLSKWTNFLGVLMTCCSKLTQISPELIPVLYRGVKDLPTESIAHLASLKKDNWYMFPNFTKYVTEFKYDDSFMAPDNAVVFEVHGAVDGVELGDISQFPEDREWMLPLFSSFSVVSIEPMPDRNNILHVILRMRGSLAGALRDEQFPEEHRSLASIVIKKAKTDCMIVGEKSHNLARMIYANIKLNAMKAMHPEHVVHTQYVDKFAEVKRASQARQQIDDGIVKWQQCIREAEPQPDGSVRPASWENLNKKQAGLVESLFLKCTRTQKQFATDGVAMVDFKEFSVDFGKGVKRIHRIIGKQVSHPFVSC
jgi:hypothetical protein